MRIAQGLIILLAFTLVALAGCNTQNSIGAPKPGNDVGAAMDLLRADGIHVLSSWEADGVTHVVVFGADQRAILRVREAMGQDVVIWNEEESLFVRGEITEVSLVSGPGGYGSILVEGLTDKDTVIDKAYLFIGENTRILQTSEQGWGQGQRALVFSDLKEGQTVEVWITGAVLESYPPKAGASKVVIMD